MTEITPTPDLDPNEQSGNSENASFAETALKLGGKSDEEARRTGAIDKADDLVESMFKPEYQTVNSPAHKAVWDRGFDCSLFQSGDIPDDPDCERVMTDSLDLRPRCC